MDAQEILRRVGEAVWAGRSFGPVEREGETLLVPVAVVVGGGGGGDKRPGVEAPQPVETGAGVGFISVPLGVYVIRGGSDVRFVPTVDVVGLVAIVFGVRLLRTAIKRLVR